MLQLWHAFRQEKTGGNLMKINSINNCNYRPNFGIVKIEGFNFQKCNPKTNPQVKKFIETLTPDTFSIFSDVHNRQINNNILDINIKRSGSGYGVFLTPNKEYKVLANGKSNYKPNEEAEVLTQSFPDALKLADVLATAEKENITSYIH